jgi:vacuolar-type H+-ATPase subunit H
MSDPPQQLSVLDVVDELEEVVSTARRVPLSANVLISEDEVLELVDRIRLALPEELVQARHAVLDRERLVRAAEQDAEQILAHAEQESQRLLGEAADRAAALLAEHELTRQAQAHAASLVAEAEQRSAQVRAEADEYARSVMSQLEEQLGRALTTVRKGIEALPRPAGEVRRRPRRR